MLYGTSLGALRNKTILPHTEDLDIGLTPLGVQFLELNATREELWRYGYAFWHDTERQVWKLCPHAHHPSSAFQAVMVQNQTTAGWQERNGRFVAGYMDAWLVWPVPHTVKTCTMSAGLNVSEVLAVPWDGHAPPYSGITSACEHVPISRRLWGLSRKENGQPHAAQPSAAKYCALEAAEPLLVQPGSRTARIGGQLFPMAVNAEA